MLTHRVAADLLASLPLPNALVRLVRALGLDGEATPLDAAASSALGVPEVLAEPVVVAGPGTLRALLLRAPPWTPLRPLLVSLAQRLSSRAPHQRWLACVVRRDGSEGAIVAWEPGEGRPRLSALLLHPERVLDSDVDSVLALAAASGAMDAMVHARWCEILGRDALSRRF